MRKGDLKVANTSADDTATRTAPRKGSRDRSLAFSTVIMSTDTGATCKTDFVVINGDGRSLLCRETAEQLCLLRLGPIHAVNSVNTEADIKEKYKELFNGVDLLKDYELKLNIDNSVKPVAQPVCRIPFGV